MPVNVDTMMYHNEVPWHQKGVKLDHLANSEEAIKAAGLDWTVEKRSIFFNVPNGNKVVEDKFAVVRTDRETCLGIVGNVYTPLQNKHAFRFFDDVIGQSGSFYETAGALGAGERIWLLAKLPDGITIKGVDEINKYMLLTNSHNGSSPVMVMLTPIRVVCQNTLNLALSSDTDIARMRHCMTLDNRIDYVRKMLGLINQRYSEFETMANRLANKMLNHEAVESFLKQTLFAAKKEGQDKMKTRAKNILEDVQNIFEHGEGNDIPAIKHTAWTAFNAVTEYVDHVRSTKGDNRDASILFGSGNNLKQTAWQNAIALL